MASKLEVRVEGRDSDSNGYETICWGCKLQLTLPCYSPIFKCGYCGAVTVHETFPKPRSRWSLPPGCISLLDHFLVTFVFLLVLLIIGEVGVYGLPFLFCSQVFQLVSFFIRPSLPFLHFTHFSTTCWRPSFQQGLRLQLNGARSKWSIEVD